MLFLSPIHIPNGKLLWFKLQNVLYKERTAIQSFSLPFSLCVFKCLLKWLGSEDAWSHWLHLFDFYPLCIAKCVLKWAERDDA